MSQISRDPAELVAQTIGKNHQYPDGFALFLGTMFAPDRGSRRAGPRLHAQAGRHRARLDAERLGVLENKVTTCDQAPPWNFGIGDAHAATSPGAAWLLARLFGGRILIMRELPIYPSPRGQDGRRHRRRLRHRRRDRPGRSSRRRRACSSSTSRKSESRALVEQLDGSAHSSSAISPTSATLKATLAAIEAQAGPVAVLVNNAANDDRHTLEEVTPGVLGRAHRREPAPLLLRRAGSGARHEGAPAAARSSTSARSRGTWACRTWCCTRRRRPASKG